MTAAPSLIISAVIRFGIPKKGDRNDQFSTEKNIPPVGKSKDWMLPNIGIFKLITSNEKN